MTPTVHADVFALAPGFRAVSLVVESRGVACAAAADDEREHAGAAVGGGGPPWAGAHLAAWQQVFRRFGARPQRTPSSAEALRKRFQRDGRLPAVNPVVDVYNAVSLRFAVPVGGENLSAYAGDPRLVIATGTESFDTVKDGLPCQEHPDLGEVVWRDDRGVTCRRWNWRQCVRTRLDADARQMWFILESLPEMPADALNEAGAALERALRQVLSVDRVERVLLAEADGSRGGG
jgi:DNA/RNA-binding domain of Phe-tRNA-synthetase-like protein